MWGANDPDCRKPMVWDDLVYADEVALPDGTKRAQPDKVEVNRDLRDHYKKLIALRHELPALRTGTFENVVTDDARQIYGFRRQLGREEVLVLLNNSPDAQEVSLDLTGEWQDRLGQASLVAGEGGKSKLALPPRRAAILQKQ